MPWSKKTRCCAQASAEQDRYKRRWGLRLNRLPETDGENIRGICACRYWEVCSISLCYPEHRGKMLYTVSETRERRRTDRQVIIMFALSGWGTWETRFGELRSWHRSAGRKSFALQKNWASATGMPVRSCGHKSTRQDAGGKSILSPGGCCRWPPQGGGTWLIDSRFTSWSHILFQLVSLFMQSFIWTRHIGDIAEGGNVCSGEFWMWALTNVSILNVVFVHFVSRSILCKYISIYF